MEDSAETLRRNIGRLTNDVLLKRWQSGGFSDAALAIAEAEIAKRGLDTSAPAIAYVHHRDKGLARGLKERRSAKWRRGLLTVVLVIVALLIAAKFFGISLARAESVVDEPLNDTAAVAAEARAFMAAYEIDLRAGDRAAVAARYAPEGAIFAGFGPTDVDTHAELAENYRSRWQPPSSFRWCNVLIEPLSADTVAVNALFEWGSGEEVGRFAYTGLLVRRDGRLTIRLEHENQIEGPEAESVACEPLATSGAEKPADLAGRVDRDVELTGQLAGPGKEGLYILAAGEEVYLPDFDDVRSIPPGSDVVVTGTLRHFEPAPNECPEPCAETAAMPHYFVESARVRLAH
jgi:hypothetical protein